MGNKIEPDRVVGWRTISQVARKVGLSFEQVRKAVERGPLRGSRVGRRTLIHSVDLYKWRVEHLGK